MTRAADGTVLVPDQPITARERLAWAIETLAAAFAIAAFLIVFTGGLAVIGGVL